MPPHEPRRDELFRCKRPVKRRGLNATNVYDDRLMHGIIDRPRTILAKTPAFGELLDDIALFRADAMTGSGLLSLGAAPGRFSTLAAASDALPAFQLCFRCKLMKLHMFTIFPMY